MQSFDHAFYAEKLRKAKYDLNDEELKPYFPLEQVQTAVFNLSEKLYGLQFSEKTDIETYHSDVKTYEVTENGVYKAILYVDYFPRKGKRAGAWMTS
jgi:peptidyl-dipeptidase Dcp